MQNGKETAHLHVVLQGMPQMEFRLEPILVLSSHAFSFEIPSALKVHHDALHGPLRDSHFERDVSNADIGPEGDAIEDVRVIAQERPFVRL